MVELNYVQEAKSILKYCIEPKLKNNGFKKTGNTFYRQRADFIDVCNVQFGSSNTREYAYFTYNIKIIMPNIFEEIDIHRDKKLDCSIADYRLGTIMGIVNNTFMSDYWYKLGYPGYSFDYESELVRNAFKSQKPPEQVEESRIKGKYFNSLELRYDRTNIDEARKIIMIDIDDIVLKFFNSLQTLDDLAELIITNNLNYSFETLFLLTYFIGKGRIEEGLKYGKVIYGSDFFKEKIDKYLGSKGLFMK